MNYKELKDKSKALRIAAMKSKAPADRFASEEIVGVLSEAENIAKKELREVSDNDVTTAINRGVKRVNDMITTLTDKGIEVPEEQKLRKEALMSLLPKQMTEEELERTIVEIIFRGLEGQEKNKGNIMKALKAQYNGQYDGTLANKVVTRILS